MAYMGNFINLNLSNSFSLWGNFRTSFLPTKQECYEFFTLILKINYQNVTMVLLFVRFLIKVTIFKLFKKC